MTIPNRPILRAGKALITLSLFLSVAIAQTNAATQTKPDTTITGPYQSGNLSVFLIHGKNQIKDQTYLTLQEALEQKKVVVHETGNVNNLAIDNLCGSVVFIQGGDIVKGGQQDRTMQQDMLLQPNQKNVPLPAFCVEHGRWSERAGNSVTKFDSAGYALAGKEIKLAAKKANNQQDVWSAVEKTQTKLSENLASPAACPASPTSYQLTLENKNVQSATKHMVEDLKGLADNDKDTIGYAFAVNGKVNSADVYASHDLFKKLWPKMLNASAIEAVTEENKQPSQQKIKQTPKAATVDQVKACLMEAEQAPKQSAGELNTAHEDVFRQEDSKNVVFCTVDKDRSVSVHKNYMKK